MTRKWPVGSFVPCSSKHKSCSPAHAEFVRDYQAERFRQEILYDDIIHNKAEYEFWKANGNRLIDFKDWLKGKKRNK